MRAPRVLFAGALVGLLSWLLILALFGPALAISHDELNFLFEALRLPAQRRLDSFMHGPLTYELLAAEEVLAFLALKLAHAVVTPVDFLASVFVHLRAHLALGRMMVGAFSVACVFQLYRLARRFAPDAERAQLVGALAAFACVTNLTFVVFSSMIKEDVIYWFLTLWGMNQAWALPQARRPGRAALLAGATLGAAFSVKYFGVFGLLLCLIPLLRAAAGERRAGFGQCVRMGIGAAAAIVITFPFLFVQTHQVLGAVQKMGSSTAASSQSLAMADVFSSHLPNVAGWGMLLLALPEIFWRVRRDGRGPIWLAVVPLMQLLFLGLRSGHTQAYYFFPVVLFCFALAAASLVRMGGKRPLFLLLIVGCTFASAYLRGSLKWCLTLTAPDTRLIARERLEALAPPGARVLVTGAVAGMSYFGPPLRPLVPPPATGSGTFSQGQAKAIEQMSGPRFDVKLIGGFEFKREDTRDVDWIVAGRFGELSHVELGDGHPWVGAAAEVPVDFERVAEITAKPQIHTYAYPCFTILDYQELAQTSLSELWKERARGPSFTIYRRSQKSM